MHNDPIFRLGLGCMRFPSKLGQTDMEKTEAIILTAVAEGINFFDTAFIYPGSEVALGKVVAKNNLRHQIYIATKLPLFKCHKYEDFDRIFNAQLANLQTDYIDYYFMHHVTKLEDLRRMEALGIKDWLAKKQAAGQIRKVGFSFHGMQGEFLQLIDAFDWDFAMIQYNYMNVNYQAGVTGLKHAASKNIPVFVMEPLLGGRLATGLPKEAAALLTPTGKTPAQWALAWLYNQPEVTMVLSGMGSPAQIKENAAGARNYPPHCLSQAEIDTLAQVAEVFEKTYKIPCTSCNYCLPCPAKINIPDSFNAYNASYAVSRFTGIQQYATTSGGLSRGFSVYDCIHCGKCEKACPQEIKIMAELKNVGKRMEPWWFRAGIGLARKFMK